MPRHFDIIQPRPRAWTTRVVVGAGVLEAAASFVAREYERRHVVVVSDARVARLYGAAWLARIQSK